MWTLPFLSILKVDRRILNVVWMEGNNSMWSKRCKLGKKKAVVDTRRRLVLIYNVMMDVRGRERCWAIVLSLWGGFTSVCVLQRVGNILLMKFCKYLFGDIMAAVNSCIKSRSSFKYSLKWNALPLFSRWSNAIKSYIPSRTLLKLSWRGAQILRNLVFLKRDINSQSNKQVSVTLHRLDPKRDIDVVMLQYLKISSLDHAVGGKRTGFKSLHFEWFDCCLFFFFFFC